MKVIHFITAGQAEPRIHRARSWLISLVLSLLLAWASTGQAISAQTRPLTPFLRVLGIAQDGGLPHAACSCERCERSRQQPDNRTHVASVALVLPTDNQVYLFDATPDLREQLASLTDVAPEPRPQVNRDPIAGVFLTHAHIGHYLGLAFFGYEAIHTRNLPVMATPRMAHFLRSNGPWSQLVSLENIHLEELTPGNPRSLGDQVVVRAVQAPHRDEYADTLGFLISGPTRTIFYLPDTDSWSAWPTPVSELLQEVDVALLDGTFFSSDELPGRRVETIGHPLIQDSMELLQGLVDDGGLEVYFTHLNHSNPALDHDSDARNSIEKRGFHVLEQGQEFPL